MFVPCENLASSRSQLHVRKSASGAMLAAIALFLWCWCAPADAVVAESSRGVLSRLWRKHHQRLQPADFGPGDSGQLESKATDIWVRGWSNAIVPSRPAPGPRVGASHAVHILGNAKRRRQERSRSHEGLVTALAVQFPASSIAVTPRPGYGSELAATVQRLVGEFGPAAAPPGWSHPMALLPAPAGPPLPDLPPEAWKYAQGSGGRGRPADGVTDTALRPPPSRAATLPAPTPADSSIMPS